MIDRSVCGVCVSDVGKAQSGKAATGGTMFQSSRSSVSLLCGLLWISEVHPFVCCTHAPGVVTFASVHWCASRRGLVRTCWRAQRAVVRLHNAWRGGQIE